MSTSVVDVDAANPYRYTCRTSLSKEQYQSLTAVHKELANSKNATNSKDRPWQNTIFPVVSTQDPLKQPSRDSSTSGALRKRTHQHRSEKRDNTDPSDTIVSTTAVNKSSKRRRHQTKDPSAPKRPMAPFLRFLHQHIGQVKTLRSISHREAISLLGEIWSSETPEARRPYVEAHEADLNAYKIALTSWNALQAATTTPTHTSERRFDKTRRMDTAQTSSVALDNGTTTLTEKSLAEYESKNEAATTKAIEILPPVNPRDFVPPKTRVQLADGYYKRPRGAPPKGCSWDKRQGVWIQKIPSTEVDAYLDTASSNCRTSLKKVKARGNHSKTLQPNQLVRLAPQARPERLSDGSFRRPLGRPPKGYSWHSKSGVWLLNLAVSRGGKGAHCLSAPIQSFRSAKISPGAQQISRKASQPDPHVRETELSSPLFFGTDGCYGGPSLASPLEPPAPYMKKPLTTLPSCTRQSWQEYEQQDMMGATKSPLLCSSKITQEEIYLKRCIAPKSKPFACADGSFRRPRGKAPAGYSWDRHQGAWQRSDSVATTIEAKEDDAVSDISEIPIKEVFIKSGWDIPRRVSTLSLSCENADVPEFNSPSVQYERPQNPSKPLETLRSSELAKKPGLHRKPVYMHSNSALLQTRYSACGSCRACCEPVACGTCLNCMQQLDDHVPTLFVPTCARCICIAPILRVPSAQLETMSVCSLSNPNSLVEDELSDLDSKVNDHGTSAFSFSQSASQFLKPKSESNLSISGADLARKLDGINRAHDDECAGSTDDSVVV
jgi:hypothetical protein